MKKWFEGTNLKCVVLCGGKGTRLLPASLIKQKGMLEIKQKPIIKHIIDYWLKFTDDFIFVVKYRKEDIIKYVKTLPIKSSFVEPLDLKGIADGIYQVKELVGKRFIVVLGDCVCKGDFEFPDQMEQGVGVWKTACVEDIKRSYSVVASDYIVTNLEEKPKIPPNDLCGMGFYFFDKRLFAYIEKTKPSLLRNEIEITDVIQNMILNNEKISPVYFTGKYLNVTYVDDLSSAETIL